MSTQSPTPSPRLDATAVFRIRLALVGALGALLALVFAVPRAAPPAPSLEQPDEAFVDRVGLVSRDYLGSTCKCNTLTSVGWLHGNDETAIPTPVG